MRLESFVEGEWRSGSDEGRSFFDPTTGEELGTVDATGVDLAAALSHARTVGGPALRAKSFEERAAMLRAIADTLVANREKYGEIARRNSGNTALDAAIDIDGGIGTLKFFARLGSKLGDRRQLIEQGIDQLSKENVFCAGHVWTSRPGAAVHINAFNFPSWGLWEKAAVAILSGVPVVAKPASATAWLSYEMVKDVVGGGQLPDGTLSLICGAGEGLLDAIGPFDCLAFTGSSETASSIRNHPKVLELAPRLNVEADSLNATILGPDVTPGDAVFGLLIREIVSALTVKAGQLCTNIRRVLVPAERLDDVSGAVAAKLAGVTVGNPANEGVRLGPLVSRAQQRSALDGLERLKVETDVVTGGGAPRDLVDADPEAGAFVAPTLLRCADPDNARAVHETEVFGPAATLMPYRDMDHATTLANAAGGSLVASVFTDDSALASATVASLGPTHGRILVVDSTVGKNHTGHAIVMPQCVHGGPGRAGGGEELGGLRGLRFYMQRTAVQGAPALIDALDPEPGPTVM